MLGGVSEPDLFVVCKNCSAEVSPYVTECPYCGQRVRKRAPRIERGEPLEERRSRTALPPLRPGEIPGIAPETRPYATIGVIVVAVLATLVVTTNPLLTNEIGVMGALGNEPWRLFSTPFVHGTSLGYGFVTMLATGIFGMHLERRLGRRGARGHGRLHAGARGERRRARPPVRLARRRPPRRGARRGPGQRPDRRGGDRRRTPAAV